MAAALVPKEGKLIRLVVLHDALLALNQVKLRLFKNDLTPDDDTELADFTEADFAGYAEFAILYGVETINGGGDAEMTSGPCDFVLTGGAPQTVYGWYLIANYGGTDYLLSCRRFASPVTLTNPNDTVEVFEKELQSTP